MTKEAKRRWGDLTEIPGNYQFRVLNEGFASQRFWHHAKLLEAERKLDPQPGDLLLDVGCGSGILSARLAEYAHTQVIGIDSNPLAIDFASQQFQRHNLEYKLGYVDELDIASDSVAKIAFLEVIEHIYPEQALTTLKGFFRILRPGGRLVISTPNAQSLWPLIEWTLDRTNLTPHMDGDQHVKLYTKKALIDVGKAAGFELLNHCTINALAPWLAPVSWRLALKTHELEVSYPHSFGSLLLQTFIKPM